MESVVGPGLLTRCLRIDRKYNGKSIFKTKGIKIFDKGHEDFLIAESSRVGVSKDLKKYLRFYIKDNKHVSKKVRA